VNQLFHVYAHPDGGSPLNRVRRLDHEYELSDYEWDPRTGEARCEYQNVQGERDGSAPLVYVRTQPSGRWHAGWMMWNGRFTTERRA
jgi:hypothetical protein